MTPSSTSQQTTSYERVAFPSQHVIDALDLRIRTKTSVCVRGVQNVANVTAAEQEDVGVDTLGKVSREILSWRVAKRVERRRRRGSGWSDHLACLDRRVSTSDQDEMSCT